MPKFFTDIEFSSKFTRNTRGGALFGAPMRDFLGDVGEFTQGEAARLAPEGVTRRLRESHVFEIESGPTPLWVEVRPESPYAAAVHEGSRPHWAPIAALRPWAEAKGINPYAVQRSIARKGTKPHPWLPGAARAGAAYALRRMGHLITAIRQRWER